jgi:predicted DNA-binding protein YlxM (UPF0122 family)
VQTRSRQSVHDHLKKYIEHVCHRFAQKLQCALIFKIPQCR